MSVEEGTEFDRNPRKNSIARLAMSNAKSSSFGWCAFVANTPTLTPPFVSVILL